MKKSDIRRIIKEEVVKLIKEQYLTEAFGDPKLAMINKLGGLDRRWGENFWNAAAKTYDLAWDKLPKGKYLYKQNKRRTKVCIRQPNRNQNIEKLSPQVAFLILFIFPSNPQKQYYLFLYFK